MADPVAVAGVGYTTFSRASGRPVLDLAADAAVAACADAGLPLHEVDGIASHMVGADSENAQAVGTALALPGLRLVLDLNQAGHAPCNLLGHVAAAIAAGHARARPDLPRAQRPVRAEGRVGPVPRPRRAVPLPHRLRRLPDVHRDVGPPVPARDRPGRPRPRRGGHRAPGVRRAQRARRPPHPAGPRRVLRRRRWSSTPSGPPTARRRSTAPARCSSPSLDRARDLRHPPAGRRGSAYRAGPRPGLDLGDHVLTEDYTRNFTDLLRDELFGRAGISPADVDVAELYDCFTSAVLMCARRARALRRAAARAQLVALRRSCRSTRTAACSGRATCTG